MGEIQLKRINIVKGSATLSIHMANNEYKNQGWGTEAIRLLLEYALHCMQLNAVHADCVHRNQRSQHVLEKMGFVYAYQDDILRYYTLNLR